MLNIFTFIKIDDIIFYVLLGTYGEVSEWSKVLDSKSSVVNSHRGFESHPLRHFKGFMAFTKFRESHF